MNMQNKCNMQRYAQFPDSYRELHTKRLKARELITICSKKTRVLAGIEPYCSLLLILNQATRILVPARYRNT